MRQLVLRAGIACLRALYAFLKLAPTKSGRVLFLSRQADTPSVDFRLLEEELRKLRPQLEIHSICCRQVSGREGLGRFVRATLQSMRLLASSEVCVLDAYWPAVSLLNHKPELTVIQMWHSLGKIKRSGLAAVGMRDGRSPQAAALMRMHRGYDYVIAGAPAWNPFYCESFGCSASIIRNTGLPRLDLLTSGRSRLRARVYNLHPELINRRVVVYAPTFRRNAQGADPLAGQRALIELLSAEDDIALVVKEHPNQPLGDELTGPSGSRVACPDLSTLELLSVAGLLISDYSATIVEAASAGVPFVLYCFDHREYLRDNGLNLCLPEALPHLFCTTAQEAHALATSFAQDSYPWEEFRAFEDEYTISDPGHSTRDLACLVLQSCTLAGRV